jgi:hypothetical protein
LARALNLPVELFDVPDRHFPHCVEECCGIGPVLEILSQGRYRSMERARVLYIASPPAKGTTVKAGVGICRFENIRKSDLRGRTGKGKPPAKAFAGNQQTSQNQSPEDF